MRPIWSPTVSGIVHQPSPHARMPRSAHVRAYSRMRSSTAAGIAPSEWLIRYVVCSRIGKRSRYVEQVVHRSDELANDGDRLLRLVAEDAVAGALEDAQLRLRDRGRDVLGVGDRRDRVELAAEHERRAADVRQLGEEVGRQALVAEEVVADLELEPRARDHVRVRRRRVVDGERDAEELLAPTRPRAR